MQRFHRFRFFFLLLAIPLAVVSFGQEAAESDTGETPSSESMAAYLLKDLNGREQSAYKRYEKALVTEDVHSIETELQSIVDGYEALISAAPNYVAAFISYGMMLHRIGERIPSNAMLIRADQIDPYHAIVKNQLGNYQAEEGNYPEAMGFYQMAIDLRPDEPLYHYQLGNLLFSYKNFFIDDKLFLPEGIDLEIQNRFRKAAMLAPAHLPYRLRYAQSFFDIARPNWEAALEEWQQLVNFVESPEEKQMMQLYMAKTRFEMGHHTAAQKIIKGIDEPSLEHSKDILLKQINAKHPR
ncbi:tetratricopeptide repeat protein [Candidatus Pelagisphaera phototrophica]|uniref:tetratricopeptide repeat protein n=1 Tax=Candidatus Pelagisphaera phototrophica TaxID=2684113 RepID=UPI0019DBA2C0|nr:tetratricopeptide repeat protein [Candidatus Pelagisphaera phototrophica]QXD32295.1 tetratricopeptide repeat protein [Candidatus Pelagisphaera phototrophica]